MSNEQRMKRCLEMSSKIHDAFVGHTAEDIALVLVTLLQSAPSEVLSRMAVLAAAMPRPVKPGDVQ